MIKSFFKNILVVQDAYRDSVNALKWADRIADGDSNICVMDVQPQLGSLWHDLFEDEFEETQVYQRHKDLRELVKGVGITAKNVSIRVPEGRPIVQIVQEAISSDRDLIIKEAFTKYSDFLFGSLDMRIIRYAPIPVWLTKPGPKNYNRILVAVNPEADEKEMLLNGRLLQQASAIAKRLHATLYVVSAYDGQMSMYLRMDGSAKNYERFSKTIRRKCREKLNILFESSAVSIDSNRLILNDGLPDEVILSAVMDVNPELIVIGSIARHGISGLLIGNTAERVLRQVNRSVLTVKPTDFVSPIAMDMLHRESKAENAQAASDNRHKD